MRTSTLIAAALLCLSAAPALAGAWEDALAAHDAGRYEAALTLLRPLGEAGNVDAQNKLSHMYWYGEGTGVDYDEALAWSRRAAEQGSPYAHYDIGVHYRSGKGVPAASDAEAFEWFMKAAELGDGHAALIVALSYGGGLGVQQDPTRYLWWLDLAVERGDPGAQYLQGRLRLMAPTPAGLRQADTLLQAAAAGQDKHAQYLLGQLFLEGDKGWGRDLAQAHLWLTIAAQAGCLDAVPLAKSAASGLSPAQLAESAALVQLWHEAHPVEPGRVHPVEYTGCAQLGHDEI